MKNSTYILIHRLFKGIADATIKIFIPLLIYKSTHDLRLCFIFCITNYALTAIMFIALKKFIQKFSLISIIIHIIPIIVAEFLLIGNLNIWILLILAFLEALSTVLYYGALNLIFPFLDESSNTAKFETGQNIGKIIFTILSSYILGKLTNSLIFVVIASLILYALSIIPLFLKYKDLKKSLHSVPKNNVREVIKDNKYFNFSHFFQGIFSFFVDVFLPLYLYSQGLSFTSIGLLVAGQYVFNILCSYFAKFMQGKGLNIWNNIIGSLLLFVSLLVIMLVRNVYVLYIFSLIFAGANQIVFITLFDKFVKDQKQKGYYYDSIFYRDVFLNSARMASSAFCLIPLFPVIFAYGMASSICLFVSNMFTLKERNTQEKKVN